MAFAIASPMPREPPVTIARSLFLLDAGLGPPTADSSASVALRIPTMPTVAILGAGPVGAAIAQKLAERGRCREIRLIDTTVSVASGKALDIMQSGPIGHFDTRIVATDDPLAATGAEAIVLADEVTAGEWQGEKGLARVQQLVRAGTKAPFVFAGPNQVWLMEASHAELKVPADRMVGTAPSGLVGALRAVTSVELGLNGVEFAVTGRPPEFVVGWSSATFGGMLVTDRIPAHRLVAISQSIRKLWPPAAQAIAAPTAQIVEGLVIGSRKLHQALTILDGEFGARRVAAMLPLRLGHGRVLDRVLPSLSAQERTQLVERVRERNGRGREAKDPREFPGDSFLNVINRHVAPEQAFERRRPAVGDTARHDEAEVAEVGRDVQRESVARDPSADADADRRELFLAPGWADPDAGQPRHATPVTPNVPAARMRASSRSRTYRWTSHRSGRRSTIGYPTSWPGPWYVTSPPRPVSNTATPAAERRSGSATMFVALAAGLDAERDHRRVLEQQQRVADPAGAPVFNELFLNLERLVVLDAAEATHRRADLGSPFEGSKRLPRSSSHP